MQQAKEILQKTFGYSSFRHNQADIIRKILDGGDAFVLMPTGGGKSLCYQIPALVRDGVGVIVSPLIALMQDQVDALKQLGIKAAFLNSTMTGFSNKRLKKCSLGESFKCSMSHPKESLALKHSTYSSNAKSHYLR